MKVLTLLLFAFLKATCLFGQNVQTLGDNSPAVIARNFSVTYGVRSDAVEAILWVFEEKGYNVERRKKATGQIIKEYAQSPEKQQKAIELSNATRHKLGISDTSKIANALEWDLFARNHYLSTTGQNSPAVVAEGDVNIWYGIPPKALRALAAQLEKDKSNLANLETKLIDQVKKYKELKTELETYKGKEEIYGKAEALLEEGRLEEADKLISSDFAASMKRQAYKGYIYGKVKELNLQYDSAAVGFKNAINNNEYNSTYHLYYANNEINLAHYDEAIRHHEIALEIDTLKKQNEGRIGAVINSLGGAWQEKGDYSKAIGYYEKAFQIVIKVFGENHPNVATEYNNLGLAWALKEDYDKAISYYEKSLQINLKTLGEDHPSVATNYDNLGGTWEAKGEYGKAIGYYEKSLHILLKIFGENHPSIATGYNNFGIACNAKGEYDKAIGYLEKALKINVKIFGEHHPKAAANYSNLGSAWREKGGYDKAIGYDEKALQINLKAFGENHPSVAINYKNLGLTWQDKGKYDKAIGYYEKALQFDVEVLGENHSRVAADYNNLGAGWQAMGEYDKAIGYYEKSLQILLKIFGETHPKVPRVYNNFGVAWQENGEYDKAIGCYEKALQFDLKIFGKSHSNVATDYNNLGSAWLANGEHDKAIGFYEKALQIDIKIFGENHPSIAVEYNNLGSTWHSKGSYDKAIGYYEKCQKIWSVFLEPDHPKQKMTAQNLSLAANNRGIQLYNDKNYQIALLYFEKGLQNAQKAGDNTFSLTCLNNIGCMQKLLQEYSAALQTLDKGLEEAAQINTQIDKAIREKLTPEMLAKPETQAKIAELKNLALIRRMQYHKVGCLKGLKRDKEAETLARQLWQEGIKTKDTSLLEDLKKEGYDFGRD
jgi:tetratricopeptide (TPR) repeat protein